MTVITTTITTTTTIIIIFSSSRHRSRRRSSSGSRRSSSSSAHRVHQEDRERPFRVGLMAGLPIAQSADFGQQPPCLLNVGRRAEARAR